MLVKGATSGFPHKGPVTWKTFSCHDVIIAIITALKNAWFHHYECPITAWFLHNPQCYSCKLESWPNAENVFSCDQSRDHITWPIHRCIVFPNRILVKATWDNCDHRNRQQSRHCAPHYKSNLSLAGKWGKMLLNCPWELAIETTGRTNRPLDRTNLCHEAWQLRFK